MNLTGNTILITGGGSGIGFALAKRFAKAGSEVIICGRRAEQLALSKKECPSLHTVSADISRESERISLFQKISQEFPKLNVLINNAGVQNRPPSILEPQKWTDTEFELAVNLHAPIHLANLFASFLAKKEKAAMINVTSGLAFCPISFMPVYCASKAALHSFSQSLRHQLSKTSIEVIEVAPPMVQTDLGGKGLHNQGVPLDEFADHSMKLIAAGELEFGFGTSETRRVASKKEIDAIFAQMNP